MGHQHEKKFELDADCCSPNDSINDQSHSHMHDHDGHDHDHEHESGAGSAWKEYLPLGISFVLLSVGLIMDHIVQPTWMGGFIRIVWYALAYIPVGVPVISDAIKTIKKGDFFSEFFLMTIATIGAFYIGEYPEGVAVMLFYATGELFQSMAVRKSKANISSLIDGRPDVVSIERNDQYTQIKASEVPTGSVILIKPGEKVCLDGTLISTFATLNTASLTGESRPYELKSGDVVLAGMINLQSSIRVKTTSTYDDSKLSRILTSIQDALSKKAPTELFIRKFAKIYTPIVVGLAAAICLLPLFFIDDYHFNEWLYRALIFLVISCPCALVISIPLGYFGGIGAASRHGILFKGSNYLDALASIQHIVMDKTGTLTEGVFQVATIEIEKPFETTELLGLLNSIESHSTHPIATAVKKYVGPIDPSIHFDNIEEIGGHGLSGHIKGVHFLAGNTKLLKRFNIDYPDRLNTVTDTILVIGYNGQYAGYLTISDKIKSNASKAVSHLNHMGILTTILSGDKQSVVDKLAAQLSIRTAFGDLLPDDKARHVQSLKSQGQSVAFIGDGINDAPVIALSDVGMAMGGLGSDAAIETADVVIQDDDPYKIVTSIEIGRATKKIVWQNIALAFGVKLVVLALGAGGIATMWEAVFADVGVALLAILNAVRIQKADFKTTQ